MFSLPALHLDPVVPMFVPFILTDRARMLQLMYPEWAEWNESYGVFRMEFKAETLMASCCNFVDYRRDG